MRGEKHVQVRKKEMSVRPVLLLAMLFPFFFLVDPLLPAELRGDEVANGLGVIYFAAE